MSQCKAFDDYLVRQYRACVVNLCGSEVCVAYIRLCCIVHANLYVTIYGACVANCLGLRIMCGVAIDCIY